MTVPMAGERGSASVARRKRAPRLVALDGVKLELAIAVCVLVVAGLVATLMALPRPWELALLAVVGIGCGLWIGLRARSVVSKLRAGSP